MCVKGKDERISIDGVGTTICLDGSGDEHKLLTYWTEGDAYFRCIYRGGKAVAYSYGHSDDGKTESC